MSERVKPERGSTPCPDHIMLSYSEDPHTTATVTWRTDTSVEDGWLECRPVDGGEAVVADAVNKTVKTDIDESVVHWATPRGLTPGTKYVYTVGNGEHRSSEYTFETEPENLTKFKFIVITDFQNATPWELPEYAPARALITEALEKNPDCRFIFTAGDNSDDGQNEAQWNGFFYGLKGIVESMPIMMCTGNHDNRGFIKYAPQPTGKFYLPHADLFDAKFEYSYPKNGPEEFETENYSFDYGNVHFAVFGINAQDRVGEWLYNDLQKSNKTWKLGAYHFPVYPVMPEGVNDDSYPHLQKGIEYGRLDVLFEGHEHSLARTFPLRDEQLFDSPSMGTVHYIAGNAGSNIFCSNCQKVWHSMFWPQEEKLGVYAVVEVDGEVLKVTAYTTDGRIADEMIIDKTTDTLYPYALAPVYLMTKMTYKGRMLELEARGMYCQKQDAGWFAAFPVLVQAIGGRVIKTDSTADCEVYGCRAVFTAGSDRVHTEKGEEIMCAPAYMSNGQLYVPVADAARIFGMEWQYAERNNFINFNRQTEEKPLI